MDTLKPSVYPLFSVVGIEIEYMVVDKEKLNIQPIVDQVFHRLSGKYDNEIDRGAVALNNELALHVIELKNNGPTDNLWQAQQDFYKELLHLYQQLEQFQCTLMPTGMHPWLDPMGGIALWPHGERTIYETYNRIFDCRGHGWSNLQSMHVNMPFSDDNSLMQLHNAIRIVMPMIPALAASTPVCEGKTGRSLDNRLRVYAVNQQKIPAITGDVIPEFITGLDDYEEKILKPMYRAIAPHDPEQVLQEEWLNSRGAIVRFDRNAVEIRVIDSQECTMADFSCAAAITGVIQSVVRHTDEYLNAPLDNALLKTILFQAADNGLSTEYLPKSWLSQLGLKKTNYPSMRHVWHDLIANSSNYIPPSFQTTLEFILSHGNLAERILKFLGKPSPTPTDRLLPCYQQLCQSLQTNRLFEP